MKMILLTTEQAEQVRGKYDDFNELQPIEVVEGYALPVDIIDNLVFKSVKDFLLALPQQEVTFIEYPDIFTGN